MFVDKPYGVPDEVITDQATGLTINIPLGLQVDPDWVKNHQDDYRRILAERERRNIKIDDMLPGPQNTPSGMMDLKPRTGPARLPKKLSKSRKARGDGN